MSHQRMGAVEPLVDYNMLTRSTPNVLNYPPEEVRANKAYRFYIKEQPPLYEYVAISEEGLDGRVWSSFDVVKDKNGDLFATSGCKWYRVIWDKDLKCWAYETTPREVTIVPSFE